MELLPNLIFSLLFIFGVGFFIRNIIRIKRNINLGKPINRNDRSSDRWINMLKIAFGQSKMVSRPFAGFLHIIVYVGFVLINIELIEIVLDGILGTHRLFAPFLGFFYNFLIATFEILAFLVILSVILFWSRRNITKLKRFWNFEMNNWPKRDANYILYFEVVLMILFLSMNSVDSILQEIVPEVYVKAGSFPISQFMKPLFLSFNQEYLIIAERVFWWMHITGILIFANYLYYSKHLHILLAFPNTYYGNLNEKGGFKVDENITKEVKLILNIEEENNFNVENNTLSKFGASDVFDLNWVQLMNAYSCTECGRCTSVCPANITGKKLSPRKIMMDTRDRLESVGRNINSNKGKFVSDNRELLNDYISPEEIWACTSCNACVEACPIEIDPLSIIMDMRQYLVMEKSQAPSDLNNMMSNIENNGAPWPFNNQDRLLWSKDEN
jgi:heterodisulfide reductase subunit C